jgi:hypothetical protein
VKKQHLIVQKEDLRKKLNNISSKILNPIKPRLFTGKKLFSITDVKNYMHYS